MVSEGGRSSPLGASHLATGGAPILDGRRQPSCGGTSRMTRECHVRICERLGGKFPVPTRHYPYSSLALARQLSPAADNGPPDRSAAHRRPLSRGSNPCGYP